MGYEIRGLRAEELEAHSQLVYESYYEYVQSGERPFLADPHWWLKGVRADPYYYPEQTRVLCVEGRLASSVTVYTREMYAGNRRAKVGCIGSVCTHPDFRRRGLLRELLAATIAWMEQEGYHWSFLFGLEDVYGGSGWRFFSAYELIADLRLMPRGVPTGLAVRPADLSHELRLLMEIYDQFNSRLTGPLVRSEAYWRQRVLQERFGPPPTYYLVEIAGQPIGYFAGHASEQEAVVIELGWRAAPADFLAAILRYWPERPIRFRCFLSEMIGYLREISDTPSAAAHAEHENSLRLPEVYKGLWRYIGPGDGAFPEITDTESLRLFLRRHEYNFWPIDSF